MKVRILRPVGEYLPGQEIEMEPKDAAWLLKGGQAVNADLADEQATNLENLTVAEMHEKGLKNVASENLALHAEIEKAAQAGKPVASGEPLLPTGGVTPATTVFPAMAKAAGHEVTEVSSLKADKKAAKEDLKVEAPKVEDKKDAAKK